MSVEQASPYEAKQNPIVKNLSENALNGLHHTIGEFNIHQPLPAIQDCINDKLRIFITNNVDPKLLLTPHDELSQIVTLPNLFVSHTHTLSRLTIGLHTSPMEEQLRLFMEFREELEKNVEDIKVRIGTPQEYIALAHSVYKETGETLFKFNDNGPFHALALEPGQHIDDLYRNGMSGSSLYVGDFNSDSSKITYGIHLKKITNNFITSEEYGIVPIIEPV